MGQIEIVNREDIQAITNIDVNGQSFFLGEHRDFRRHETLRKFIPNRGRISLSWTALQPGETLETHCHPTVSMIVVYDGSGELTGDLESSLVKGDVVTVPSGSRHGFKGGVTGLYALSIQFEGNGLYEVEDSPRVEFLNNRSFEKLKSYNSKRLSEHVKHPFFNLISDGVLHDEAKMEKFKSLLKSWSSSFQKVMFTRQGLTYSKDYSEVFKSHLKEEIGHDELIDSNSIEIWDPVIAGCVDWFLHKMVVLDNFEKAAVVHLVLEASAHEFHELAYKNLRRDKDSEYFNVHAVHDEDHSNLANYLFLQGSDTQYQEALSITSQAWDILETMLLRMHKIIIDA